MAEPDDSEASSTSSLPREYFTITCNGVTSYRHTTGTRDLIIDGERYTAIAAARGSVGVAGIGQPKEMEITLPIDHAFVKKFTKQGCPPSVVDVTWMRTNGGASYQIWSGRITSMACEDSVATFRVPSTLTETVLRTLPSVSAGTACPLLLYGDVCGVSRAGSSPGGVPHLVTTSPIMVSGRTVTVDLGSLDRNGNWALHGELVHPASGERRTVLGQADQSPGTSSVAVLTLRERIPDMAIGHTVQVYAGCDHSISGTHGCGPKFGNRNSFRGFNRMPSKNIHDPRHLGVMTIITDGEM